MFYSASKLGSPQRQTISLVQTDPVQDSPSRQRIKLLSDKWSQIQTGLDKDKVEKKDYLEERIKAIEDFHNSEKPKDEQKFKILKDQMLKLQDQVIADKQDRENFDEKRENDLKVLQENLMTSFDNERLIKQKNEVKIAKQVEDRFTQISLVNARDFHAYEEKTYVRLNDVRQQMSVVKSQIDLEKVQREESAETLSDTIEAEINKFQDQILIEKKVREETQNKIFRMIEEINGRLMQEIQIEKKERQGTTDALLKLLEDACIKIDKKFRY